MDVSFSLSSLLFESFTLPLYLTVIKGCVSKAKHTYTDTTTQEKQQQQLRRRKKKKTSWINTNQTCLKFFMYCQTISLVRRIFYHYLLLHPLSVLLFVSDVFRNRSDTMSGPIHGAETVGDKEPCCQVQRPIVKVEVYLDSTTTGPEPLIVLRVTIVRSSRGFSYQNDRGPKQGSSIVTEQGMLVDDHSGGSQEGTRVDVDLHRSIIDSEDIETIRSPIILGLLTVQVNEPVDHMVSQDNIGLISNDLGSNRRSKLDLDKGFSDRDVKNRSIVILMPRVNDKKVWEDNHLKDGMYLYLEKTNVEKGLLLIPVRI